MKQFSYDDIQHTPAGEEDHLFYFTGAMVSTCAPLFDNCEDNYAVEDQLTAAKVIRGGSTDSESCQLFVYFKTRKAGASFIDRLNAYLQKLAAKA